MSVVPTGLGFSGETMFPAGLFSDVPDGTKALPENRKRTFSPPVENSLFLANRIHAFPRPVGTFENSPAIYCREIDIKNGQVP